MPELRWSSREQGIDDLESFFEYAGYKARDLREPLGKSRDYIRRVMEMQFATEGEYRSGGWQELDEDYEAWKMHVAPGRPILELTGEMEAIVLADESWHITMRQATFLPPSEKAGWHQEGLPFRSGGGRNHTSPNPLPARPILDLDEFDYMQIEDIWERWLDELASSNPRRTVDPSIRPSIFG